MVKFSAVAINKCYYVTASCVRCGTVECTYFSSCFSPEQKSTLSIVADVLGAVGGFAGKYSTIATNNRQLHAHSVPHL